MNATPDESKYHVFYDSDCGFCNFWVCWILKHDRKDQFLFASLQGDFGQNFLLERGLPRRNFNTIYLWKPKSFYLIKSQAVLKIAKILGGKYGFLAQINFLPIFLTDKIYDYIAKNRKKFLVQNCEIPSAEERKKFLN